MVAQFGTVDFIVFIGMLVISMSIGIFYAVKDRNKNSIDKYNYGGRNMPPFAVAMSISVGIISAVNIITWPTEAYLFGTIAFWHVLNSPFSKLIALIYYVPLLFRLKLPTIYQLLELRFNKLNSQMCSTTVIISGLFYSAICIYIPALSMNAVLPIGLYESILIISVICTFYTTIGGMKAVIWTDVVQTAIMFAGALAIMIKTIADVGGVYEVKQVIENNNRNTFLNFDPNPLLQRTFWTLFVGLSLSRCYISCCSPVVTQLYFCCKSEKHAKKAVLYSLFPPLLINTIAFVIGLALNAYFHGCDPVLNGEIMEYDQLVPYLSIKIFENVPGLAGLFVASAFSATLSTVSSHLNSISLMISESCVATCKPNLSENRKLILRKLLATVLGAIIMSMAFVISNLEGTVVSIVVSVYGGLGGPIVAVFNLAIFTPWCNSKGAFAGQLVGVACSCWLIFASAIYGKMPETNRILPLTTDQCVNNISSLTTNTVTSAIPITSSNFTTSNFMTSLSSINETESKPALYYNLYSLSFGLYFLWGFLITFITGLIVSFATGANKASKCNPKYFVPLVDNKIFPQKIRTFFRFGVPPYTETEENRNTIVIQTFSS